MSTPGTTNSVRELSEDEIKTIYKKYALANNSINHNGIVNLISEIPLPADYIKDFEPALKKNKGCIKFNTFIKILHKQCGVVKVQADPVELTKAFRRLDINRDGFIDLKEMQVGAKAMQLSPKDVNIMMRAADTDRDGRVDFQEFLDVIGYDSSATTKKQRKSKSSGKK